MSREKKYVPPFTRAVSGIMKQQSAVAIARLRDQSEPRQRAISAGDLIFPKEWQTTFEKRVEPIRQRAYSAILKESLKSLGVAGSFTFTETMRDVLRKQGAHLVTNVYKTTIRRIAGALEVSAAKGEGIDATAKRIESVFDVRRSESLTIARTEMLRASQAAQIESYDIGEVDRVAWHTARDAKVRDTHAVMEGVTVERGQLFTLGDGEMARAPGIGATGDPLSAGNSINCRCFTVPVFDDEGGGEDG
jgi:SPP1 gp7 family putative phage head morphogenesis protein